AWPGCVETRSVAGTDYDVSDAPGNPSDPDTLFVPAFGIDEPEGPRFSNNYIVSSADPLDRTVRGRKQKLAKYGVATDAAGNPLLGGLLGGVGRALGLGGGKPAKIRIDTSPSSLFDNPKGPGLGCEVAALSPLSSDYKAVKDKVNSLQASGTNILEGVAWGWRVLSAGAPFSEGATKKTPNLEKIMVVLTDGTNVFGDARNDFGSSYTSLGYRIDNRLGPGIGPGTATTNAMNARTLAACENAKADGTTIYTIRLEEPNVATGTMLQECATSPDMYFDVPSRTQLDEVFAKIRDRIVKVRLSS
ncbi:MAG: hypothetical protein H0T56_02650, partial [Pseudaminobacter sp.]|nr:hypothetical protein [Pseudaminobacter sp.]